MASNRDSEQGGRELEALSNFLKTNDLDLLLLAYVRGEVGADELTNELTARYLRTIGSAVQALAEHDKALALQVIGRIRDRAEELLQTLASRDTQAAKLRPAKAPSAEGFKGRDDDVLQREYLVLTAISKSDFPLKAADIFDIVHRFDERPSDNLITTHLTRMHEMGIVGKSGKGRYHKVAASTTHLALLADALEARGLRLPQLSE